MRRTRAKSLFLLVTSIEALNSNFIKFDKDVNRYRQVYQMIALTIEVLFMPTNGKESSLDYCLGDFFLFRGVRRCAISMGALFAYMKILEQDYSAVAPNSP